MDMKSRFEPVWAIGKVKVGATNKELFLVDGSDQIDIGYSIDLANVEEYR
jgi:hypothetical protein